MALHADGPADLAHPRRNWSWVQSSAFEVGAGDSVFDHTLDRAESARSGEEYVDWCMHFRSATLARSCTMWATPVLTPGPDRSPWQACEQWVESPSDAPGTTVLACSCRLHHYTHSGLDAPGSGRYARRRPRLRPALPQRLQGALYRNCGAAGGRGTTRNKTFLWESKNIYIHSCIFYGNTQATSVLQVESSTDCPRV